MTEKIAASYVHDMLLSIKYLHSLNIVHRALKPRNFVFETDEKDANIVLLNFARSKLIDDNKEYNDLVGTVHYLSPELVSSKTIITGKILKSNDIWAIGVITYVMLTGRVPFAGKSNKEIFCNIVSQKLSFPSDITLSDGFKEFVTKTLIKDPSKRITLDQALRHPWVQGKDASEKQLNEDVLKYLRQFNYQSKLKKAITRTLAANMLSEPEKEIKAHFMRLDKDGDGYLNENELKYLLLDMGYAQSKSVEEAKVILAFADDNNDGRIDFQEFKQIYHRRLLSSHNQYIQNVFNVFDENGDGFIDAHDLQDVLGDDFKQIQLMIKEVDENNDGKLSFDEFKKAMQESSNDDKLKSYANVQITEKDRINDDDII